MKVIRNLTSRKHKQLPLQAFATRLKPRTRSDVTIWSLPEELQLLLLQELHIKDLLSMKVVHSHFCSLIENNTSLWTNVDFYNTWPNASNKKHFEQAAEAGNVEALLKLGVSYLYGEGLPSSVGSLLMTINGNKAASMFRQAEVLTPGTSSFTWLFMRPPWSLTGSCCKEYVFKKLKESCQEDENSSVLSCVAQILLLLGGDNQNEAITYLEMASSRKSLDAAFLLWQQKRISMVLDKAGELKSMRCLRDIASLGHTQARLSLCRSYAAGSLGGISVTQAASTVREFVQSSTPLPLLKVFQRSSELTHSMRYILLDWLVEVAGMKDFSSLTLHTAINVVDRFLICHNVPRTKLQLLGVASMVLCSRLIDKDIITVREAAWLTDNTYKYEDVVRMMGEIVSTLKGKIRVLTVFDYVQLFCEITQCNAQTRHLCEYLCEMALLELTVLDKFSLSRIAASCVLLAQLTLGLEAWPRRMITFTGYQLNELMDCCVLIHSRCYVVGAPKDHRDVKLQAVMTKFGDDKYHNVGDIPGVDRQVLADLFGVEVDCESVRCHWDRMNPKHLIMSPSRHMKNQDWCENLPDRDQAGTPTLECSDIMNESAISGYEGDKEDADESWMDFEDEDPDLNSLWCADHHANDIMPSLSSSSTMDSGIKMASSSTTKSSAHKSPTASSFVTVRVNNRSFGDSDVFVSDENSQGNVKNCIASPSPFLNLFNDLSAARTRVTRRSGSREPTKRPALRSVNVPAPVAVGKPSTSKRKSTQDMGNENKIHIKSP